MSETVCIILGIGFWVLAALAVVCGLIWAYVRLSYMRMDRFEHERKMLMDDIENLIVESRKE